MLHKDFNLLVAEQLQMCMDILTTKDKEYSSDEDRLHNFKVAAALQGITPREAVRGMMAKHVVSVFDMCGTSTIYPSATWDEKLTDTMNYCMLLKGIIQDEKGSV